MLREPCLTGFPNLLWSCMVNFYTRTTAMAAEKTVAISFRVSPRFKALLEVAAVRENRSLTNMLETLLFAHCDRHGLKEPASSTSKAKGARR